jgi:hypothetical protein
VCAAVPSSINCTSNRDIARTGRNGSGALFDAISTHPLVTATTPQTTTTNNQKLLPPPLAPLDPGAVLEWRPAEPLPIETVRLLAAAGMLRWVNPSAAEADKQWLSNIKSFFLGWCGA